MKYPGDTLAEEGVSERSVIVEVDSLLLEIVDSSLLALALLILILLFWKGPEEGFLLL